MLKILHLTDTHLLNNIQHRLCGVDTNATFAAVVEHVVSKGIQADLAVVTGDIAQQPSKATYARLAKMLQPLAMQAHCLAGNHDEVSQFKQLNAANCKFYATNRLVKQGKWWLVMLNTSKAQCVEGYIQNKPWLRATLAEAKKQGKYVAIWMHHHPLPIGSAWMDRYILRDGDWFVSTITQFNKVVKAVLHGHVHQDFAGDIADVPVWATPSTCFQFVPRQAHYQIDATAPGYRVIELHNDGTVHCQVQRLDALPQGLELDNQGYGSN